MKKVAAAATFGLVLHLAFMGASMGTLKAAELKVLAGGALTGILGELGPAFERDTGHKLSIQFAATPDLIKAATSGTPFDLGVTPIDVMQNEAARAQFAAGQPVTIARAGFGVAVKAGAPKPDVSTPEALKATLLKARSVAVLPASAAGAYVTKVFERLGIATEMEAKAVKQTSPAGVPQAVAKGDAELGVFLTNVLTAPGVDIAGPFPGDLQNDLVFVGALSAGTREADAAKAFIAYLQTPASQATIRKKGMKAG
jgi:molybdate transport system substrate-binding protein